MLSAQPQASRPAVVTPLQRLFLLIQLFEVTALSVCLTLSASASRRRPLPVEVPSYLRLEQFCGKVIVSHPSMLAMHENEVVHTTLTVKFGFSPASLHLASLLTACGLDKSSAKTFLDHQDTALCWLLERQ